MLGGASHIDTFDLKQQRFSRSPRRSPGFRSASICRGSPARCTTGRSSAA
jgi:hypothetical protein